MNALWNWILYFGNKDWDMVFDNYGYIVKQPHSNEEKFIISCGHKSLIPFWDISKHTVFQKKKIDNIKRRN